MADLYAQGERRHEECRFGTFASEAFSATLEDLNSLEDIGAHLPPAQGADNPWKPIVMPLCAWRPKESWPPTLTRVWGGAIEFDRDCAACPCFERLRPSPDGQEGG